VAELRTALTLHADPLASLHDAMAGHVESGTVPGLVTGMARGDEVHVDTIGTTAVDGHQPMRRDAIFRITSMTKPVVAVATMMLVEEGVLRLDEPVDRLLPELADRRVLVRRDGPLDETVPARRPITVEDLLTFRMGIGLELDLPPEAPVQQAVRDLELVIGPPLPPTPHPPDEWMRRLGTLPLLAQPGERWIYDTGASVLGVLVARASGTSLGEYFRERIFDPLGMVDTAFTVPPEQLHRLPPSYDSDPETGAPVLYDGVEDSVWRKPPVFPNGAAGLVSTLDDYLAFGRMLAEQGRYPGGQLLSPATAAQMTTDQLTPEQHGPPILGDSGWGLGMAVSSSGRFGWDGGCGTSWFSDADGGVAVLLTQRNFSVATMPVFQDFRTRAEAVLEG
jgi:CubicO group peptidase (beta-lactamase class C family)